MAHICLNANTTSKGEVVICGKAEAAFWEVPKNLPDLSQS